MYIQVRETLPPSMLVKWYLPLPRGLGSIHELASLSPKVGLGWGLGIQISNQIKKKKKKKKNEGNFAIILENIYIYFFNNKI